MCASSVNTERYNSQSWVSTALAYRYNRAAIATSSITPADSRRRRVRHADRLGLEVLLIALLAVPIAEPALLGAAERTADPEVALAVDRDVARAHPLGQLERPIHVSAADLTGQPVDRIVRDRNSIIVAVVRRRSQHWAEDLFLRDLRVGIDVGQQRRLHVIPRRHLLGDTAARHQPRA